MTTAESSDSMTDTLSAINIEQLTSSAMGAFGHSVPGLFGTNEQNTVLPAAVSSSGVTSSLPSQTIPLMVSLGTGDKQTSTQGTLPPLNTLIKKQNGFHSIRHLLSPALPLNVSPSVATSSVQTQDSTVEVNNVKSGPESLSGDKSVLSGVFPLDVSTPSCHQTSALLSQLASLVQGNAHANQLEVPGIENPDHLEGIDSNFLQNSTASTDIQIANLQSVINLILTNPSLQNSATCQTLLNILNQSSSDSASNTDFGPVSQGVDISQLLNGDSSVQTGQSGSMLPANSVLPPVPSPSQSVGSTVAITSIVPSVPVSIPSSLPGISSVSIQSTSNPASVISDSSQSQPIDASQVTYIRQLINSQVSYADTGTLGQTANQMISVKQDPSLSSAQPLLISGDHLEPFYTVTTSSDTMAVENLLQPASNTQVAVATMNYQDYAALQNSLNSYLQSSADNEEVTLPSNLTMENINAAIQSEDPKGKKSALHGPPANFTVDYCVICDGSKCSCLSPVEYTRVEDRIIPSRARLSMPSCLEIRLSRSSLSSQVPEGVYAVKHLQTHTKFGPLMGEMVKTIESEGLFPEWRVMEGEGSYYISTSNEELSNWLRFIRPAQNIVEQNLVVHQVGQSLYFFAKRDIKQGEELLYWFSKEYAVICGYSVIPKPSSVNECPVCATMFRKRQALRQHLADNHRDSLCNVTEDSDPLDPKSKSKKKGDSLELVTCPFCKKVLASNSNLKKHLAVHKGERNFKCEMCLKSFRQKAHLESHMGIHKVEKIRCSHVNCDRTFNRDTDRKLHEKTHTKTGLFQCESCKKTFTKKQNYKRHILIHTGQKNFRCDLCNKDYYTKYHLQRHKAKCRGADKYPSYLQMEEGVYDGPETLGVENKGGL